MQNKILVITLSTADKTLETAYIIRELKRKYPQHELSLLTFKQNKHLAHMIKGVKRVYSLDKQEIHSLYTNSLYSNGFALSKFFKDLSIAWKTRWDLVINLTQSPLSNYLTSSFNSEKIIGSYMTTNSSLNYSSLWAATADLIINQETFAPLKSLHCTMRMCGLSFTKDEITIITNEKNNTIAFKNINHIRNLENMQGEGKVIGINITNAVDSLLSLEQLRELIETLFNTTNFIPLLIVETQNDELKRIVNHLNSSFDNALLSVETDDIALPSLLLNLDGVIASDKKILMMANLLSTPTIALFDSIKDLSRYHSENDDDISIIVNDMFSINNLYHLLDFQINLNSTALNHVSPNCAYFITHHDTVGGFLQEKGNKTPQRLLALVKRYYLTSQQKHSENKIILEEIQTNYKYLLSIWMKEQKNSLMITTKLLLRTLRTLLQAKNNPQNGNQFIHNLNLLLKAKDPNFITHIPLEFFEFNLTKLSKVSPQENLIMMEHLIYDTKNSLQKVMTTLSLIESKVIPTQQQRTENHGRA